MQLLSPERMILNTLKQSKHDKWGFVINRCTYEDNQGWELFKHLFHERTENTIRRSDAPEAADSLERTFVEDRAALEGASRSQLRDRFNRWADLAFVTEQPRAHAEAQEYPLFGAPRYNYFIQVDEEALKSVLAAPRRDNYGEGFVNLADSRWKTFGSRYPRHEDDDVFEPIDGRTDEDVGWMRVAARMINTCLYEAAIDFPGGVWYVLHQRPPGVLRN